METWTQCNWDISGTCLRNVCGRVSMLRSTERFDKFFIYLRLCVVFFHTDQPANISGFELQGRSSTNQYVTKFTMGYKSHANQNGPQDYPNDQSTKVPESRRTSSQDIIRLIKQQKGNVEWRLEEDAWNSLDPVLIWPYLGVCFACSVVKWRSCSLVK